MKTPFTTLALICVGLAYCALGLSRVDPNPAVRFMHKYFAYTCSFAGVVWFIAAIWAEA